MHANSKNVQYIPYRPSSTSFLFFTHDLDRYIDENQENEKTEEKKTSFASAVRMFKKTETQLFKLKTQIIIVVRERGREKEN